MSAVRPPTPVRLIERLVEGRPAWDGLADRIDATARTARGGGPWRRLVTGQVLGHAAHPFLTDLPIGFFTSAAALDLAGGESARAAARQLVGAGLATAPAAALTGLAEYAALDRRPRRLGAAHALLNGVSVGLYAASWVVRPRNHRIGVGLGITGLAMSGLSAYLGGHLAIGEKVGTTTG